MHLRLAAVGTVALAAFVAGPGDESVAHHGGSAQWLNGGAPTDSGTDWGPSVATDGAGTWVAAWSAEGTGFGADFDILFARSFDGGHSWSGAESVDAGADADSGDDVLPQVQWGGPGTWMVVWKADEHGSTGADADIFFARSNDGAATWSPPEALNTNAPEDTGDDGAPQVRGDGAGNWVAVWDSTDTLGGTIGIDPDILVAASQDDGITWSAPAALNSDAASDSLRDLTPEVATDGQGHWVAAWETLNTVGPGDTPDNDMVVARSSDNGATWMAREPLNAEMLSDTGQDHLIQIETSAGMWLAIWHTKRLEPLVNTRDVVTARSYDFGQTWTATADVRTDTDTDTIEEYAAQVAGDGHGNWVVAWEGLDTAVDPEGDDYHIYGALSTDDGVSWEPTEHMTSGWEADTGQDVHANVAGDPSGNWVVVWDSDVSLDGQVGPDREILYVNCLPFDLDDDGLSRCADTDDDADLVADGAEWVCGSDGMDAAMRPERLDGGFGGVDDDGDAVADEILPAEAMSADCDGDGYSGAVEAHIFETPSDQDPCGVDAWPADIVSGGIPNSTQRVNLLDITSFLGPTRRLGTNPEDAAFSVRWDLSPGAGLFSTVINLQDMTSLITVRPAMLGAARANNGPACPWPA